MKISLSQNEVAGLALTADVEAFQSAIQGSRLGDWESKRNLDRFFLPLIQLLAAKRSGDNQTLNKELMDRARDGLHRAAKRFPIREPARRFWVFALDYMEAAMDRPSGNLFGWRR